MNWLACIPVKKWQTSDWGTIKETIESITKRNEIFKIREVPKTCHIEGESQFAFIGHRLKPSLMTVDKGFNFLSLRARFTPWRRSRNPHHPFGHPLQRLVTVIECHTALVISPLLEPGGHRPLLRAVSLVICHRSRFFSRILS